MDAVALAALTLGVVPWAYRAMLDAALRGGVALPSTTIPIAAGAMLLGYQTQGFAFWFGAALLTFEILMLANLAALVAAGRATRQPVLAASWPVFGVMRRGDRLQFRWSRHPTQAFRASIVVDTRRRSPRALAAVLSAVPLVTAVWLVLGLWIMFTGADRGDSIDHKVTVPVGILMSASAAFTLVATVAPTGVPSLLGTLLRSLRGDPLGVQTQRVTAVLNGCVPVAAAGLTLDEWRQWADREAKPAGVSLLCSVVLIGSGDLAEARRRLAAVLATREGAWEKDARLHLSALASLNDGDAELARDEMQGLDGAYLALAEAAAAVAEGRADRVALGLDRFESEIARSSDPEQLRAGSEWITETIRKRLASTYRESA